MLKGHGGNIHDAAKRIGCLPEEVIDMSSNMNPLGPPSGLIDSIRENIESICTLPEVDAKGITTLLAQKFGIPSECVLAGNGTTQFIYSIPKALGSARALIVGPTYSDYEDACVMNHVEYSYFFSDEEDGFDADIEKLLETVQNFDTVFICNPNNPTGSLISGDDLERLCRSCPETFFIVDESYLPFAGDAYEMSAVKLKLSNVIVLNSMSKIYRIPGLRIGFLIASVPIIYKFAELSLPWSVNAIAQSAVKYVLQDEAGEAFLKETRGFIETEKELFLQRFNDNSKITLFSGTVYYLIAKLDPSVKAEDLCRELESEKILIRNCANFIGLPENIVRFSLKDRDTNMLLADKITEFLNR